MARKPPLSTVELVERLTGCTARVVAEGRLSVIHLDGYPGAGYTTLVTVGLGAIDRTFYRGRDAGFELVACVTPEHEAIVHTRLVEAVIVELDREASGRSHERYNTTKIRGVMYNGVYAAPAPPHLLFATDLRIVPALDGRHRMGERLVDFLPAIPITNDELAIYDRSPPRLIDLLRKR